MEISDDKVNSFENTKRQTPKMTFVFVLKRDLLISFDLIRELTVSLSPNSTVALNNHETQDYSKCKG